MDEAAYGLRLVLRGVGWVCSVLEEVEVGFEETLACLCGVDQAVRTKDDGVVGADGVEEVADAASGIRVHTSLRSKAAYTDLVGTAETYY